jgi:hypothetical protein
MFKECRRLSDWSFADSRQEINEFLGLAEPGKHPGHWMSLFPKPVCLGEARCDEPFAELHPQYGNIYRVGGRADRWNCPARHGLVSRAPPRP